MSHYTIIIITQNIYGNYKYNLTRKVIESHSQPKHFPAETSHDFLQNE